MIMKEILKKLNDEGFLNLKSIDNCNIPSMTGVKRTVNDETVNNEAQDVGVVLENVPYRGLEIQRALYARNSAGSLRWRRPVQFHVRHSSELPPYWPGNAT